MTHQGWVTVPGMQPHRTRHRPRDYLPRDLHDVAFRIGGQRTHNLAEYWHLAIASAAAAAAAWNDAGRPGPTPLPPAVSWSEVSDPVEVRWTQTRDEETEHLELLRAAGSTRTAVLAVAAHRYVAADGHLITLMRATPGRLTPGPASEPWTADLDTLLRHCPPGCPLVSDTGPCRSTGLPS